MTVGLHCQVRAGTAIQEMGQVSNHTARSIGCYVEIMERTVLYSGKELENFKGMIKSGRDWRV